MEETAQVCLLLCYYFYGVLVWRQRATIYLFSVLSPDMKKFIIQFLFFLIPVFAYCVFSIFILTDMITIKNGPNTKQQIDASFNSALKRDYDLLILGNSRMYRGINPDIFSIKAFNFSHDNDSYNQLYYKLRFLEAKKKRIQYLILGVDYFQFSFMSNTRNYVYADYLGLDYLKDFNDRVLWLKCKYYLDCAKPNRLLYLRSNNHVSFLKENGQYIRPHKAKENDSIKRNVNRLAIQVNYLKKILDVCRSENIKVFMVMLPVRKNEMKGYTSEEIKEFDLFIHKYVDNWNTFYLNYGLDTTFKTEDYTDLTHLNEKGADRFSRILNDSLLKIIPQ